VHNTTSPLATMRPLTSSAGPALRSWTKHPLPATRIASAVAVQQRRSATQGEVGHVTSFDSPFRTTDAPATTKIPSFKNYMSKSPEVSNRVFSYFVVGSMGLLAAAGAKATVQGASECN
jgi:ubiquinol-cytochrome c reductase iron-sulfur subunit